MDSRVLTRFDFTAQHRPISLFASQTHRVTAVLGCLASVAPILVSEKRWLGGQKHILPLLELALPGIDINDPTKVSSYLFERYLYYTYMRKLHYHRL